MINNTSRPGIVENSSKQAVVIAAPAQSPNCCARADCAEGGRPDTNRTAAVLRSTADARCVLQMNKNNSALRVGVFIHEGRGKVKIKPKT